MKKFDMLIVIGLLLGAMVAAQAQQSNELERVQAASRKFVAAVSGRDVNAIDAVWAHESYASFIGPLSTKVVVGWDGGRQAWQMRFGQFDRVSISMDEPHIRVNGEAAWVITGRFRACSAIIEGHAEVPPASGLSTTGGSVRR